MVKFFKKEYFYFYLILSVSKAFSFDKKKLGFFFSNQKNEKKIFSFTKQFPFEFSIKKEIFVLGVESFSDEHLRKDNIICVECQNLEALKKHFFPLGKLKKLPFLKTKTIFFQKQSLKNPTFAEAKIQKKKECSFFFFNAEISEKEFFLNTKFFFKILAQAAKMETKFFQKKTIYISYYFFF
jgi:hypothetical protein